MRATATHARSRELEVVRAVQGDVHVVGQRASPVGRSLGPVAGACATAAGEGENRYDWLRRAVRDDLRTAPVAWLGLGDVCSR